MSSKISLPQYNSSRHPIETWQEWYHKNQSIITKQVQYQKKGGTAANSDGMRLPAPYEYTDSLNQRQVWEPYLTGKERQEFDAQLRTFMKQNRTTMLRLRPGPVNPSASSFKK